MNSFPAQRFALSGIPLVLANPFEQGLWRTADLGSNRLDGNPLRGIVPATLGNHAHGALTDFVGELTNFLESKFTA